jgi:hypothetical protein
MKSPSVASTIKRSGLGLSTGGNIAGRASLSSKDLASADNHGP